MQQSHNFRPSLLAYPAEFPVIFLTGIEPEKEFKGSHSACQPKERM